MRVIGLTGSIGMGKSTAARIFCRAGVPVIDSDDLVHEVMAAGGAAVGPVCARFGDVRGEGGGIDRGQLGRAVFGDPDALRNLEEIIHPLVARAQRHRLGVLARHRVPLVVVDVPLLLETSGDARVDLVLVVSAPDDVQKRRVLRRQGMTEEKLAGIRSRQMPDQEKRRRADVVVWTHRGRREVVRAVRQLVRRFGARDGRADTLSQGRRMAEDRDGFRALRPGTGGRSAWPPVAGLAVPTGGTPFDYRRARACGALFS